MSESIAERVIAKILLDLAANQNNANNHVHLGNDAPAELVKGTNVSSQDAGAALRSFAAQGIVAFTNASAGTTIIIIDPKRLAHIAD